MNPIVSSLADTIKHLDVVRNLPDYFDEEERRLVFQSVIIGVVVWFVVFALKSAVHWSFETLLHWIERSPTPALILLPLLAGSLVVATITQYRATSLQYRDDEGHVHELNDVEGDGLERAISLYYTSEPTFEQALTGQEGVEVRWQLPTFTLAARKFLATLVTLGSGGSGGLEASVTLIGESVSAGLFKPRPLAAAADWRLGWFGRARRWWRANDPDDLQTAQLSGIAAAVAVLLGAPFAAAFFATEVMYRQRPIIEKLVYSLISSLVAYFLTNIANAGHTAIFEVETLFVPPSNLRYFGLLLLMATVISLVSIYFGRLRGSFERAFRHYQPTVWQRHLTGAALTGAVALIVAYGTRALALTDKGLELVLGPGETAVDMALAGELTITVALIALVAKMIATLATIGSGGSAGLLVPSLFFGTMVAAAFADLFDYEPMVLIIPAMTAALVSIVNVPLAAILFTVEVFGASYMVPALLVLVVTSVLAHDNTIYRTQREKHARRQIMPGVSVRRVPVPASWADKTLVELDLRNRFDVNVIGMLDQHGADGRPYTRLGTSSSTPLEQGDVLIVLGRDESLEALADALHAPDEAGEPAE
ncbi:MAG: chloride channel protein [Anaerolineae bacterium]